jgi:CopG family nickel-responsive transcriptional regulator
MSVSRFGVSLEKNLLDALDEYVLENHFSNRSQAIRHLINKNMVEQKWLCNNLVAGTVTLIYDPKSSDLMSQMAEIQSKFTDEILSSQKFIIGKSKYMEIIAVKGLANRLTELSDALISIRGMQNGKLTMSRAD